MPDLTSGSSLSRRRLLQLLGVGGAAALLPGCSSSSSSEVVWQAIPSYSLQGTDPARVDYLRELLTQFQAEPGPHIDPQVSSADTASAMAKLLLQASQGRAPDVAQVDGYVFGRMSGYAQPLNEYMRTSGLDLQDWFPSLQPIMTGDGDTVRSLQFTSDVRVLYYRRDLIPTPPATWDELIAVAKPLAEQGLYFLFPGGRSEGAVATSLWPQYWAQGAELFDEAGEPAFADGPGATAMRDALGVVERCLAEGISPNRVATFGSEDDQNPDIVAGRVAMFLGGSWQAAALNGTLPDENFFDTWGVAPIPSLTGEHVTTAGGWVWAGFTEDPEQLAQGMDWVTRAYVSDEGMAAWCTAGGYLPPRQSIYDNPAYEQNPFTPTFRDHLSEYARPRPGERGYLEISNSFQIALSSVASGTTGAGEALEQALNRIV